MEAVFPIHKGLLVTTNIPTKQLILFLNEENQGKIVIKDLDDTHVLINPAYQNWLKEEITRLFDQNTFERKD